MKRRIEWSTRPCRRGEHYPNASSLSLRDDEVQAVCVVCGSEMTSSPTWSTAVDASPHCDGCGEALPWCQCDIPEVAP